MRRILVPTLTLTAFFAFGAISGAFAQSYPPGDQQRPRDEYGNSRDGSAPRPYEPSLPSLPSRLTVQAGTYVTVRVDQGLSSDRNQQGDTFFASLASPLVVNGIVVAQRGQTVAGRVSAAERAGRGQGTSRLGLQLIELTVADGRQVGIETQLVNRNGSRSVGNDVGTVGTTTALGAIIGAGADGGRGAAIGAGAGAAAGLIGVLLTRGNPTVVYPETVLTFRLERPIDIDTSRSGQAFRYVDSQDYERPSASRNNYNEYNEAPSRPYYGQAGPGYGPGWGAYGPRWGGYGPGISVYLGGGYRGRYGYRGRRW